MNCPMSHHTLFHSPRKRLGAWLPQHRPFDQCIGGGTMHGVMARLWVVRVPGVSK